jgi:hypothetical protein
MTPSPHVGRKKYGLFVLAIILILLGGMGVYLGSNNYLIRVLGSVSLLVSVYLVRISRVNHESTLPKANAVEYGGPSRLLWIVSLALVPLLGASAFLLHIDAVNGGHEAWPADVFAGVALVCAGVWGCLIVKLQGGGAR